MLDRQSKGKSCHHQFIPVKQKTQEDCWFYFYRLMTQMHTHTQKKKNPTERKKKRISFLYYQLICFFYSFHFFFVFLKIIFAYFGAVFWCMVILLYVLCIQIINDHWYNFYFIFLLTSQKRTDRTFINIYFLRVISRLFYNGTWTFYFVDDGKFKFQVFLSF